MTKDDLTNTGADNLCNAILLRAVEDYFSYRFFLDTLPLRDLNVCDPKVLNVEKKLVDTISWFDSDLYYMIQPDVEFEDVMEALNKRYYDKELGLLMKKYRKQYKPPINKVRKFMINYNLVKGNRRMPVNEMLKALRKERAYEISK